MRYQQANCMVSDYVIIISKGIAIGMQFLACCVYAYSYSSDPFELTTST